MSSSTEKFLLTTSKPSIKRLHIKEKEKLISEWTDEGIKVEKGRWGRSIISMGKKKVEIPKEIDPKTITLDIAKQYLNPKKKK